MGTLPSAYGNAVLKSTAASIGVGSGDSCALLNTGELECWGHNALGQLGIGSTLSLGDGETPSSLGVIGVAPITAFAVGSQHTCGLIGNGGGLKCWGDNAKGELGQGDTTKRGNNGTNVPYATTFLQIAFPSGLSATSVYAGNVHTCAILNDHSIRCWGWNDRGQLGFGYLGNKTTPSSDFVGGYTNEKPDQLPVVLVLPP
jgi:alpha-tubulin suppressor-like RCC1 family protein